jgi:hypothetical protein
MRAGRSRPADPPDGIRSSGWCRSSALASTDQLCANFLMAVSRVLPTLKIPPTFTIPFEVPYKNGTRDLNGITSRTDFDDFLVAAAAKMDTRPSLMSNLAYLASYKPKTPKPLPKLLDDEEAWDGLISDVAQHINASKAKNRGKGEVKPFHISLIDLSKTGEATKSGTGRKVRLAAVVCPLIYGLVH